jgi:hypothetical protein
MLHRQHRRVISTNLEILVFTQVMIWSIDSFDIPTKALTDPYQQVQQASYFGNLRSK